MSNRDERLRKLKEAHEQKKRSQEASRKKKAEELKKTQYPSIAQQAKNLVQTAAAVAKDPRWVDDAEYDRRMSICRECPLFDHKQVRCKKCGCKLKGKAKFKAGTCPIKKW